MKTIRLGKTGIEVIQNGFGALPIQRVDFEKAKVLLLKAYQSGMKYFDTARAYSDSEEKIGYAFKGIDRSTYYLASKTMATNVEDFWKDLNTSLKNLNTDYIDVYQFHCASRVFCPNDGSGLYEAMLEAKQKGMIHHIGITAHLANVAKQAIESDLYETLQFPFSYLASDIDIELVNLCKKHDMGFIAMKGLAGGLITNSKLAMAYMNEYENVLPIWGVQKEKEIDEFISYILDTPILNESLQSEIEKDRKELAGDFCRGCGYCMPCPQGILINNCARMSQMIRRAPSASWTNDFWQKEMMKIETCLHCNACASRCPYGLNTPELLIKNLIDYKKIISGEIKAE